jgi:two-component system, OmpR family, KDP operon response regulator KdpE
MNRIKLLGVDDEPQIRKLLQVGLKGFGYEVLVASNGDEAMQLIAERKLDVIILDINLGASPDGIEVCRQVREWSKIPILVLSVRNDKFTKLSALNAGADDYITKPFDIEELEARIRAVLRRITREESATPTTEIRIRELTLDLVKRRLTLSGEDIHLTPKEYELLRLLATHPGKVLTTEMLLKSIWGTERQLPDQYIRVFINTLRKKLGDNPLQVPQYIVTEPGIGYRFTDIG